jgi:hypothetical protein
VYIVGDPIKRVESHYVQMVAEEGETRSIEVVLGDIEDPAHPIVCPGRYAHQVERYLEVFPSQRMLVIDKEDLLRARQSTLSSIFSFLGVDAGYWSGEFDLMRNRSADHRRLSSGFYGSLRESGLRSAVGVLPPSVRGPVLAPLRRVLAGKVVRPTLDATLRARLEGCFRLDVERLRAITGKSFESWSV